MRFVVFSFDGYGLPIAYQLQQEGQEVLVAMVEDQEDVLSELEKDLPPEVDCVKERRLALYDGLLEKKPARKVIERMEREKNPADTFAFFDLNHLYRFAERARDAGFRGNFPAASDYRYEIDRELAKGFVDENYPRVQAGQNARFEKASEAKEFLESSEELWVLKGLQEDARTVVPDVDDVHLAREQILDALATHRAEYEGAGFILELRIPNVLELTPEKVYYDGRPVATTMCIENKPIGSGNVGPMTDCAQDLVFETELDERINKLAFPPVVDEMARQHRGLFVWDASLLIDSRSGRVYFGEYCANRPGYNCLYTQLCLAGSATRYFECMVRGRSPYGEHAVAASVRLFNFHEDDAGHPLAGAKIGHLPRVSNELWLLDVRQHRGNLVSAGYKDTVGVMTGGGRSVAEAARRAYRNVDGFSFEGAYYRPEFDFVTKEYKTSLLNRLDYGLQRGFYRASFGMG
jgi:hypothetical protein